MPVVSLAVSMAGRTGSLVAGVAVEVSSVGVAAGVGTGGAVGSIVVGVLASASVLSLALISQIRNSGKSGWSCEVPRVRVVHTGGAPLGKYRRQ